MSILSRLFYNGERVLFNQTTGAQAVQVVDDAGNASALSAASVPGTALNVTNSSKEVLAANAIRRAAIITNLSTTAMLSLSLGGTAVSGKGICLPPAADATHPGGNAAITQYTGAINGIMSAGDATAGNVAVSEI